MRVLELNSWKQAGAVHFWRFTENVKNYPGWHLATDPTGHASLLGLLRLLRDTTEAGASRTIHPTSPSPEVLATANNRRSPARSPTRVRVARNDVANQWAITEVETDVSITIGVDHLDGIIRWLSDPAAAFDTTYGEDPPLWFWGRADARVPGEGPRGAG